MWWMWKKSAACRPLRPCALLPLWRLLPWRRLRLLRPRLLRRLRGGRRTRQGAHAGNILDVKVKVGDTVKAGTVLCVLEAMKMENEIPAPKDGKVAQVVVTKGATVGAGDTLVVLA